MPISVDLSCLMDTPAFSLSRSKKSELFMGFLGDLTRHHYSKCEPYRRILNTLGYDPARTYLVEDLPFVPVRLFKEYELTSVARDAVVKTMTSSGTTGQQVSKIFLDQPTAALQTRVLSRIVSDFTGPKRLPMLVLDSKSVLRDRNLLSARGAGILGFSMMGYDVTYALDDNMELAPDTVEAFCEKHKGQNLLLFGFTFMVWQSFLQSIAKNGRRFDLSRARLIHGGGWKKLADQAVDNATFKQALEQECGIRSVHNYYGMVEQTGSIFMECEAGVLHTSIFSDVIVRRHTDFSACSVAERGLMQLVSLLPFSYPGHLILSEDEGELLGEDDCSCGRLGKYFAVYGRVKNAEIRGCSDVYGR